MGGYSCENDNDMKALLNMVHRRINGILIAWGSPGLHVKHFTVSTEDTVSK